MQQINLNRKIAFYSALLMLMFAPIAQSCIKPSTVKESTPAEIRAFFKDKGMKVVTFLGYSAAGYENRKVMLEQANRILDLFEPGTTIVVAGATPEGIGAVYETAKKRGFQTAGIVSTQAKENNVKLSYCVDIVFYVKDASWGGFMSGTDQLSPTSTAMIESADLIVAIGGGEVARDELIAAKRLGKMVQFIPADMNHELAQEKARKKRLPVPSDFRGAAAVVFQSAKELLEGT